jgi:membrane protein
MRFKFRRSAAFTLRRGRRWAAVGWVQLRRFPWRNTVWTLRDRFREDRLGVTAGSLTFTTTISLVPLFTVVLAIFSLFPTFGRLEGQLQQWLVQSLMPEGITRQVSRYLVQFSNKAGQIGWTGAVVLLVTALALVLTIDRKLNDIWRVRKPRALAQRVLVYWAVLTLGPLLLALSLSLTSYAASASRGWATALPGALQTLFDTLEFVLSVCGVAALYRYVPHAQVRWSHALAGGLFVSLGWEAARKLLAWYLAQVPTYSVVYGTFATVPILLVWTYLAWVIVLLGAVVAAYLPSLLRGVARRGDGPGWDFQLALEVLALLQAQRVRARAGSSLEALARRLAVDPLQLEAPVEALVALDWVGRLDEPGGRYVLVVDPEQVTLAPLVARLLLARNPSTQGVWAAGPWEGQTLAVALPRP